MKRILIGNIDNEDMLTDRSGLTYEFRCHSAVSASKHAWFADVGDIAVLPEPLSEDMLQYMAKVKQIPVDSVTYISPACAPTEVFPLGVNVLGSHLMDRIKEATVGYDNWELCPYHHDHSSAYLARALGLPEGRPNAKFFQGKGAELFNNKKIFRCLAAGRGIQVAEGAIACSEIQLKNALDDLIGVTGAVIIKQNCHSGALGNTIVSVDPNFSARGATEHLIINGQFTRSTAARYLWERTSVSGEDTLIVEVCYPVSIDCYAEFHIGDRHGVPRFLNLGEQRMEPLFVGFEIPGQIQPYQQAHFISGATQLVTLAQDLGFTGFIDVDGIITCDGEVLFCEVNGRYGGSSHIHFLAERLLGADYGSTHTLLSRNGVSAPLFGSVVEAIERQALDLSGGRPEGILITAEDTARTGTLDYFVAAESRARAYEIEQWLLGWLGQTPNTHAPRQSASLDLH